MKEVIIIYGHPGTGKTHIADALSKQFCSISTSIEHYSDDWSGVLDIAKQNIKTIVQTQVAPPDNISELLGLPVRCIHCYYSQPMNLKGFPERTVIH